MQGHRTSNHSNIAATLIAETSGASQGIGKGGKCMGDAGGVRSKLVSKALAGWWKGRSCYVRTSLGNSIQALCNVVARWSSPATQTAHAFPSSRSHASQLHLHAPKKAFSANKKAKTPLAHDNAKQSHESLVPSSKSPFACVLYPTETAKAILLQSSFSARRSHFPWLTKHRGKCKLCHNRVLTVPGRQQQ